MQSGSLSYAQIKKQTGGPWKNLGSWQFFFFFKNIQYLNWYLLLPVAYSRSQESQDFDMCRFHKAAFFLK